MHGKEEALRFALSAAARQVPAGAFAPMRTSGGMLSEDAVCTEIEASNNQRRFRDIAFT